MTIDQQSQGMVVEPGAGRSYYFGQDLYTFKAIGAETGNAYALFEVLVSPQGGSPSHRHTREDESFYVQAGEVEFQLDGATIVATPGSFLYSPKGQVHQFTNKTAEVAQLLIWVTPAGFEHFMAEIGQAVNGNVTPKSELSPDDLAKVLAAAPRYGIEIIPPAA